MLCLVACARGTSSDNAAATGGEAPVARVDLTGAGATFPYPLYSRWFNEYAARTNVRINYQSIGSGAGIRRLLDGAVDFGATDIPMTDGELAQAGSPILHIPTTVGAVALTYNLPTLKRPLLLASDVIVDIFLGRIRRWNAARIAALNPGVELPARDILVVHRADESGTSYILSDYLSAVSAAWAGGPGRGKDVRWPIGIGGRGNEGVAGQVKQTIGSIGYLEVVYARQNHLPAAHLRNRAGYFISPMAFEIASAAASAIDAAGPRAPDLRLSLVNAPGAHAYPIASFTWMLIAPQRVDVTKAHALAEFLRWALTDGGEVASTLGYVALPSGTASRALKLIDNVADSGATASVARPR